MIRSVSLFPVQALCLHPGGPAQPDLRRHLVVRLVMTDGGEGWGEITGVHGFRNTDVDLDVLESTLQALLENLDPANIVVANHVLIKGLGTSLVSNRIRAGVDFALHDIVGKICGVSINVLLGGAYTRKIPVAYPIPAHRSIDQIADSLAYMDHMLARGFEHVRFYIGLNLEADARCLTAVRDRFGDRVNIKTPDCNGHMDWQEALSAIDRFRECGFEYVESPARRGDIEGLANVRRTLDGPVSEHAFTLADAMRLVKSDAVDIFMQIAVTSNCGSA